jgi:hypothetical protein
VTESLSTSKSFSESPLTTPTRGTKTSIHLGRAAVG